jgi:hypothetical protein
MSIALKLRNPPYSVTVQSKMLNLVCLVIKHRSECALFLRLTLKDISVIGTITMLLVKIYITILQASPKTGTVAQKQSQL